MKSLLASVFVLLFCYRGLLAQAVEHRLLVEDFAKVEKTDIHFHLHSLDPQFMELAAKDRFKILNIATRPPGGERGERRTHVLIMSNGSFGGLAGILRDALQ